VLNIPSFFSDHLVLKHSGSAPIWGTANPSTKVTVTFGPHTTEAIAGPNGHWIATFRDLGRIPSSTLTIASEESEITLQDVVTGEVWLCSGQSNMQWNIGGSEGGPEAVINNAFQNLRLLQVPCVAADSPLSRIDASWTRPDPEAIAQFSAVAAFFGEYRFQDVEVPIGLIHASWGGSIAEAWMPIEALRADPTLSTIADQLWQKRADLASELADYNLRANQRGGHLLPDPGNQGFERGYANLDFDDQEWPTMGLPGHWDREPNNLQIDGAVWFRKHLIVSPDRAGKAATLSLGEIDQFDVAYINGFEVGSTSPGETLRVEQPRRYSVPENLLVAGENIVAVRVFNEIDAGGFAAKPGEMALEFADSESISLEGTWRYLVEFGAPALGWMPGELADQNAPAGNWNGMIAPLVPFGLTGITWYQGESNTDRGDTYELALEALILSWRQLFKSEEALFLVVQLANFCPRHEVPVEENWPFVREAQQNISRVPNVRYVVTIDIGDASDVHPRNKREVGRRLALAARPTADHTTRSPEFLAFERDGENLSLTFRYAESLSSTREDGQAPFDLQDQNGVWRRVHGVVTPFGIHVGQVSVTDQAIRYGWANNPESSVINGSALPLAPFRVKL
jgi:sialate O-acetylesterase